MGRNTRYAPITPAMAPDAPSTGTASSQLNSACPNVATSPVSRYSARYGTGPSRSSTLLPKTHRNSMFPARWKMLPWMNMHVSSDRSTTFPLTAGSDGVALAGAADALAQGLHVLDLAGDRAPLVGVLVDRALLGDVDLGRGRRRRPAATRARGTGTRRRSRRSACRSSTGCGGSGRRRGSAAPSQPASGSATTTTFVWAARSWRLRPGRHAGHDQPTTISRAASPPMTTQGDVVAGRGRSRRCTASAGRRAATPRGWRG